MFLSLVRNRNRYDWSIDW